MTEDEDKRVPCPPGPESEELKRGDYFPEEPAPYSLSDVLADVRGMSNIDGLVRRNPTKSKKA